MKPSIRQSILCLLLVLAFIVQATAQRRVVGYLPMYNFRQPEISKIPLAGLTHLNLAFLRPDSTGAVSLPNWVDSVITLAHAAKINVLISIGGGSPPAWFGRLLSPGLRDDFTRQLVSFVQQHQLDGIDVDLEGALIDSNYETFVTGLAKQLKPANKLLTAAVATWVSARITDGALRQFDFINLMSYDKTGPWTPDRPGPHAPYQMAVDDLLHWTKTRNLPARKIVLGIPFYGYRFSKAGIRSMSYNEILSGFPQAAQQDSILTADSARIFYNGANTIQAKTRLAQQAGGIMIWQLLQDAEGDASLLKIVRETMMEPPAKKRGRNN
jgi:chitinase